MKNIKELRKEIEALEKSIAPTEAKISKLNVDLAFEIKRAKNKITMIPANASFIQKCEDAGAEQICVDEDNSDDFQEVSEDDGALFITQGKIRGCFICNQDLTKAEWNKEARAVCKEMGVKFSDLK